jgi:hypothetical protein
MPISGEITKIEQISDGEKREAGDVSNAAPFLIEVRTTGGAEFFVVSQEAAAQLVAQLQVKLRARGFVT